MKSSMYLYSGDTASSLYRHVQNHRMGEAGRNHSGSSGPTSQLSQVIALSAIPVHGKLCSTFCLHKHFASDLITVLYKKRQNNLLHGIRSHSVNVKTEKNQ